MISNTRYGNGDFEDEVPVRVEDSPRFLDKLTVTIANMIRLNKRPRGDDNKVQELNDEILACYSLHRFAIMGMKANYDLILERIIKCGERNNEFGGF